MRRAAAVLGRNEMSLIGFMIGAALAGVAGKLFGLFGFAVMIGIYVIALGVDAIYKGTRRG